MSEELLGFLEDLHRRGLEHDAEQARYEDTFRNLEPETASFISMIARASNRRSILEIGTSNGYSTIWLAYSAKATGGYVTSIEIDRVRRRMAEANLEETGLSEVVDLEPGDADDVIPGLSGPFDLVFFDADRVSAPEQLEALVPKLAPDALVMADNVHSHPEEISGYLSALEKLSGFDKVVVPVGKGLSIAYRGR